MFQQTSQPLLPQMIIRLGALQLAVAADDRFSLAQDMNHAIAECPRTVTQKQALEPAAIKAAAQCTHWCVRSSYLSLITQQCE